MLGSQPRRCDAEALFAGAKELILVLKGQDYRLRLTRNGKLILTK
jgi:hemin uptake protein HemP